MKDTKSLVLNSMDIFINLKNEMIQFLPNLLAGLLILVLGLIFAFIAKWACQKIVRWMFMFVPRKMAKRTALQEKMTTLSTGAGKILFFLIVLLALTASMEKMGLKVLSAWLQNMAKYVPNVVGSVFILFLGWNLKSILSDMMTKAMEKIGISHSLVVSEILTWSTFFLFVLVSIEQIGIDLSLIAVILGITIAIPFGAIFLAFALGIRSSFEDIFACYHIKKIISVDDLVEFNNVDMRVLSLGPVFITLSHPKGSVSISGREFMKKYPIVKKS